MRIQSVSMNSAELEQLIDANGLEDVLRSIAFICSCKAGGDDLMYVRAWQSAGDILGTIATTIGSMHLSKDAAGTAGIPDALTAGIAEPKTLKSLYIKKRVA